MTKNERVTFRMASTGGNVIREIAEETGTDKSKVISETLTVMATTPTIRATVVKRLKQRKGIE